jgi:hypothetical protein
LPVWQKFLWADTGRRLKKTRKLLLMCAYPEGFLMKIDILYFEGCPNHLPTLERINEILREEGSDAEVRVVLVPDALTAQTVKFLGSPTVRVNNIDIEPAALDRQDFGLMCRRYSGGIPSHELIRTAVRSAAKWK